MDRLFIRSHKHLETYYEYVKNIEPNLNLEKLINFNLKKIMTFYIKGQEELFLTYRFSLLREWYLKAPKTSPIFHKEIKHIIHTLNLENFLNAYEKNFILETQSKQFTLERNLKSLVIDFNLEKDEITYFHYRKFLMINYDNQKIENIDFYLTNTRIVITYSNNLISFNLNKIRNLKFSETNFSFDYYKYKYVFKCDRPQIILMSFKRISSLKNGVNICE